MSSVATEAPAIAPGLHKGMSYDDYARIDAIRHSTLRHFNRTPAHAREQIVNPAASTEAKAFGHTAHSAILEPDLFTRDYVAAPKFDKRTKIGKEGWAAFQAEHSTATCIPEDEYELCLRVRDAVWAHPTAAEMLKGSGLNEVSAVWVDESTGLRCKARLDRLTSLVGWGVILDVKTTRNAARSAFAKDVHTYHYYQQGGFYLDGLNTLVPHERKFVFVAVEKEPPYCVNVLELEEDALQLGRDEYRAHLTTYADCIRTNRWPAYGDGMDYVSLPPWAFRAIGD